jgi:Protein of unknown function (DUF4242)
MTQQGEPRGRKDRAIPTVAGADGRPSGLLPMKIVLQYRRTDEMRVQWCRFRGQKGNSDLIHRKEIAMPKFLIEREIPGAGKLSAAELQSISQKSCSVLRSLPQVQWVESYVTDDKIYCVYIAPDEQAVREHARQGGFPANSVSIIRRMLDPTSAETPSPY